MSCKDDDEFISRTEFENAIDEISAIQCLHQLHLDELQRRIEDTPQRLICETRPDQAIKNCVVHHNLGLSPLYSIIFRKGHKSGKPVTLRIYVHRPGGKRTLQYEGKITGFPKHLDPETTVFVSSKDDKGKISFEVVGFIEDRSQDILSIIQVQQEKISDLEGQIEKLTHMVKLYGKPNLTNLPPEIGIPIFKQIMNAPKASTENLDRLVTELRERILSEDEEGKGELTNE